VADLPFFGRVELTTIAGLLVDLTQTGSEIVMQDTYCFIDVVTKPKLFTTTIPDRFIAALRPSPRSARLERSDGGWDWIEPEQIEIRGARLSDPAGEPLPTTADDPRVIDDDRDDRPGVTVCLNVAGIVSGETYVVQRLRYQLFGRLLSDGRIAGRIAWESEQNVIAAEHPSLQLSYTYEPHPDPDRHRFVMERIDDRWNAEPLRDRFHALLASVESSALEEL